MAAIRRHWNTLQEIDERFPPRKMNFKQYLKEIHNSIQRKAGSELIRFLPLNGTTIPIEILREIQLQMPKDVQKLMGMLRSPPFNFQEDFTGFLALYLLFLSNDGPFDHLLAMINEYGSKRLILNEWMMPFSRILLKAFVKAAIKSDISSNTSSKRENRVKAQGELAKLRAIMLKESHEMLSYMFMISNCSLELFFSLDEMGPAMKVSEQIVQHVPDGTRSPKADVVLFHYYVGRIHLYFHKFAEAEESLSISFNRCLPSMEKNRRLIFIYLAVARIIRGKLPSSSLLQRFGVAQYFQELIRHLKSGNIAAYLIELEKQKLWLINHGFYLIMLHRTPLLLFRNLFSKIFIILQEPGLSSTYTSNIPIEIFHGILSTLVPSEEYTMGDVESIFVSLIDQGYIRAYMSSQRKIVVFRSKGTPFPVPYQISEKLHDM